MPKPIFGDNGSGMHTHQSIWKGGTPLFAGKEYAGISQLCLWYIGGILKHAPALAAFTNPTVNSYKRLTPGFEAPVNLAYSSRNRSAGIRIPMYSPNPKAKRIEVRFPDPACNPYLSFAADRKSTRLNSSHRCISYAVFCLKKKKKHLQKLLQIQKPCWTYEQFSRSYHWNHPSSLLYPLLKFLTYFIRSCIQAHAQFSFVNA